VLEGVVVLAARAGVVMLAQPGNPETPLAVGVFRSGGIVVQYDVPYTPVPRAGHWTWRGDGPTTVLAAQGGD
jgi:hypothetical protein